MILKQIHLILTIIGWGLAIALFLGRLEVNIVTNQSQVSTQNTVQATVNNNYITESMVKVINTNFNITDQTNFSKQSTSFIKDMLFGNGRRKEEDL